MMDATSDSKLTNELMALDREVRAALDPRLPVDKRRKQLRALMQERRSLLRRAGFSSMLLEYRKAAQDKRVDQAQTVVDRVIKMQEFAFVSLFLFSAFLLAVTTGPRKTRYPAIPIPGFPDLLEAPTPPDNDLKPPL